MPLAFGRHGVPVPAEQEFRIQARRLDELAKREQRLRQELADVPGEFKATVEKIGKAQDRKNLELTDPLMLMGG